MLGQLTEVMSMDDVQVLYPKERIMLYGINSNCELFLPIARSSFPSYFPFCFCSLLLQRRAVAALLSPGEVHGVVLCIALVFLSFLRFLLYSVDWTSVGHSLRCGSLGLETSTLNSFAGKMGLATPISVKTSPGGDLHYRKTYCKFDSVRCKFDSPAIIANCGTQ